MRVARVRIEEDLEKLLELAAEDMQRWEDTLESIEDIHMGRVVDGNKVHAWLKSWGTSKELPAPKK